MGIRDWFSRKEQAPTPEVRAGDLGRDDDARLYRDVERVTLDEYESSRRLAAAPDLQAAVAAMDSWKSNHDDYDIRADMREVMDSAIAANPAVDGKLKEYEVLKDNHDSAVYQDGTKEQIQQAAQAIVDWSKENGVEPSYKAAEHAANPPTPSEYRARISMESGDPRIWIERIHDASGERHWIDREFDSLGAAEKERGRINLALERGRSPQEAVSGFSMKQREVAEPKAQDRHENRTNLQAAIDTFEEYAKLRDGDLNARTIPQMARAREQWTAHEPQDVVQKMAEYRELRAGLSDAAGVQYAAQDMRQWARENGVNVEQHIGEVVQREGLSMTERAAPGRTYIGPVLDVNDRTVLQQASDGKVIEHDRKALVGTTAMFDGKHTGDVEIRYPHGSVGIARDASHSHEQAPREHQKDGPSMSMER